MTNEQRTQKYAIFAVLLFNVAFGIFVVYDALRPLAVAQCLAACCALVLFLGHRFIHQSLLQKLAYVMAFVGLGIALGLFIYPALFITSR